MIGQRIQIWREEEYHYPAAHGFVPIMVSYIHEDDRIHPGMLVAPGGAYRRVSSSEAHPVAEVFYRAGYNVFVLAYTVNILDEAPLYGQPLEDISRAIRIIRAHASAWRIDPSKIAVCGFSAGGHLCGSLCVHHQDVTDPDPRYQELSNRPDAAVLAYPVITSGKYANRESFLALLGEDPAEEDLEYMSLEKQVTSDMPPCFLWQTAADMSVPVENSYLFAEALKGAGVPYAHHVFSDGVHGMSVATEDWLEGKVGDTYTLEQIVRLAEAIRAGETSFPPERGDTLLAESGITKKRPPKWDEETKERLRAVLGEVGMWPEMAERWLARQLGLRTE